MVWQRFCGQCVRVAVAPVFDADRTCYCERMYRTFLPDSCKVLEVAKHVVSQRVTAGYLVTL